MNSIPYVNSIFQQPWWLDAVAPGQWHEIVVKRGEAVVARLPYVIKKKHGLTLLTMPKLTQTLGPWIKPSDANYVRQLALQKELLTELINQLPPHHYFMQNFHYSCTNWLPFYWQGFSQTTLYTYIIEDLSDINKIWAEMHGDRRNEIRRAEKAGIIVKDTDDIETLLDLTEMTFKRQSLTIPYSRDFVRRLDAECVKRNARKIYLAYGPDKRPHAGIFCVYDEYSMYQLISGGDPELRNSGANILALWESIKFASQVTKIYDFEGSMVEHIESFIKKFGGIQKPYYNVSRKSRIMKMLMSGKDLLKAILNIS
jgi:lipid II:glycine glycyltransferase (peptidoglycan interpeptide bridge formation enzyme)